MFLKCGLCTFIIYFHLMKSPTRTFICLPDLNNNVVNVSSSYIALVLFPAFFFLSV